MFLKNAWYCVGWEEQLLGDKPKQVELLGEVLVLYRTSDGKINALDGRCPHRFAPLAMGTVVNDNLRCAYHALEFSVDGACVFNPHGSRRLPPKSQIRAYPLVVRNRAMFVWMGDPSQVDESLLMDEIDWVQEEHGYRPFFGEFTVNANYQLVIDNLLDLTHAPYLHPTTLAGPPQPDAPIEAEFGADGNVVTSKYILRNATPSPQLELLYDGARGDMYFDMNLWQPSSLHLDGGITESGDGERRSGAHVPSLHLLSPVDETTTNYFFAFGRNVRQDDEEIQAKLMQIGYQAFTQEDEPVIRACQEMMKTSDLMSLSPVMLETDVGAIRARQRLSKMIAAEQSA